MRRRKDDKIGNYGISEEKGLININSGKDQRYRSIFEMQVSVLEDKRLFRSGNDS